MAATLGHDSPTSAATNVVSPMQKLGLIDENGALTDLGNRWRNDASYAEACQQIIDKIYPAELTDFTTADGSPDKAKGDVSGSNSITSVTPNASARWPPRT